MNFGTVLLIILLIVAAALVALYFFGRKMQRRQAETQTQMEAMKQTVSMLIIDKKKLKIVSKYIDIDDDRNEPKNHVAYKLIDLCKFELYEIFDFLIKHK